jgi:hypothetical protein
MPDPGQLVGDLLRFIGDQIGASSLRLGPLPTLAVLSVLLVLLSLVARPSTRWMVRDLGRLAAVGRAMALAAESGAEAAFSLGTAGVARSASAFDRLQTLAALPILGHVARAAARAGVPLRVTANDVVAVHLAVVALADAHRRTETQEREERSGAEYVGEGRAASAAAALADAGAPAAAFADGALSEESLLLLEGARDGAAWTSFGTAAASQAGSILLASEGALIGPELYQAPSDLRAAGHDRTGALAANRLIGTAVVVIAVGSLAALAAGVDLAGPLVGR